MKNRRILIALALLLAPILLLALHFGPGRRLEQREAAARHLRAAAAAEAQQDWAAALTAYQSALTTLPLDNVAARLEIRRRAADARFWNGDLPTALLELEALLEDAGRAEECPEETRRIRGDLAAARYYAAWLMRLEGTPAEEWTVEAEDARQHFRLLAESSAEQSASDSGVHQQNLEAVIRLERMDLSELQALPLPKKCCACKNVGQRCRAQRDAKCKACMGKGKKKGDIRKKLESKGATLNERPSGSGS